MRFLKPFGRKSPEDAEKKGDALFEAGEYGLAKMEYEDGLQKCGKTAQGYEALEGRLKEKICKTKETLATLPTWPILKETFDKKTIFRLTNRNGINLTSRNFYPAAAGKV